MFSSAKAALARARANGNIVEGDLFTTASIPLNYFDVAFSGGFIEHFTDTTDVVKRIVRFAKPQSGLIITMVPNMGGYIGKLHRLADPELYAQHVAISPEVMDASHREAGSQPVNPAEYFGTVLFSVVNINRPLSHVPRPLATVLKRLLEIPQFVVTAPVWALRTKFESASMSPVVPGCLSQRRKLMRVLHVLGKLDRGGVETWLVQLLRQVDRSRYQMDFLVHTAAAGAYDDEVRALGAKIIPCLHPDRPLAYAKNFRTVLKTYGPTIAFTPTYTITAGMCCCWLACSVCRSASRTATPESWNRAPACRGKQYLSLMRVLLARSATAGIAVSELAGNSLTTSWKSKRPGTYCPTASTWASSATARAANQLAGSTVASDRQCRSSDMLAGSSDVKNHRKLVEVAKELFRIDPNIHFLLVGDGPLRSEVEAGIATCGLKDHFTLTGNRADIPAILQHAMDVFLFPSHYEGLPIALMEAQLAGLSCVASERHYSGSGSEPGMVTWLPLRASAANWANAIRQVIVRAERHSVSPAVRQRLSIESCCRDLTQLYDRLASDQVSQSHISR